MANWNTPDLTTQYPAFLQALKDRDTDVLIMNPGTNLPVGAKRWEPSIGVFQNWNGSAWVNLVLSAVGGGTGSSGGFPTLGTMATQNANAVAITGGTISGVAIDGGAILAGVVALARGGTGASLALGSSGSFLQSNGSQVVFGTSGAALTTIPAGQLVGVIPGASLPNPLPALNAGNLTNIPAGNLVGVFPALNAGNLVNLQSANLVGVLPAGVFPSASFNWVMVANNYIQLMPGSLIVGTPLGGNMGGNTINANNVFVDGKRVLTTDDAIGGGFPSGGIILFDGNCPAGWTRFSPLDGRFPRGAGSSGGTGGSSTHQNHIGGNTSNQPSPAFSAYSRAVASGAETWYAGYVLDAGRHAHAIDIMSDPADHTPPYRDMVYCQKN